MPLDLKAIATAIGQQLRQHRSALVREDALQETIAKALDGAGLRYQKELRLGPGERLDFFLTDEGVALEVKRSRAGQEEWRQVGRYLAHDQVKAAIIIAPRVEPLGAPTLAGKPVHALPLWKFLF